MGILNIHNYNFSSGKYDYVVAEESQMKSVYSSNMNHYDNGMEAYYDNLIYNFGQNYKGSCGYVALGMLLSYYDSFLNDDIIPEQYDVISSGDETNMVDRRNSPGVLRDLIANPNNFTDDYYYAIHLSNEDYYSQISAISEQSLHAKLITIGAKHGYYDLDAIYPCGTNVESRRIILEDYLNNNINFTKGSQYNIDYCMQNSGNVKNYIITKIKMGYPVLIGVAKPNGGGHACIAYDYDETKDKIYCHMGWGASTTHVTVESQGFAYYNSAMIVNFNLSHKHSNNYEVVSFNGNDISSERFCSCSNSIHIYNSHVFSYENTSSTSHTKTCACGFAEVENHIYNAYQKYNNNYHIVKCECGAQKQAVHKFVTYNIAGHEVTQCPLCGQYKYSQIIIPDLNSLSLEEYLLSLSGEAVPTCGE